MTEPSIHVARNEARGRYEIFVDDTVAGFTLIRTDEAGRTVLPHTEVDPAFGGRGLGGILVRDALADLAAREQTVVPVCPFVVKYLRGTDVPGLDVSWRPTADDAAADAVDADEA
ncbi:GNAT family N-acetyltransferase [Microbacterium dauci]|uniref:GNAT family N-acetyltransferase n=1 Tax=Microbacterium dauci TaxID=3048008 RepID=A0ABT6ZCM3_9MICO|nr:GNAT family N-acetyltransferase [Microbacterium sp. LX3-4]MDJ1113906.1 GNAT family N-acetyltransferase [Microbacterium sp. LX3-4]